MLQSRIMRCACLLGFLAALVVVGCSPKPAQPDVRALCESLKSADEAGKGRLTLELISAGEAAVPHVAAMVADPDPAVRRAAVNVLWALGTKAKAAVPQLAAALSDSELAVRTTAARALAALGVNARDAVPQLVRALGDRDVDVRLWAVKALGAIGADARSALPALERLSKNVYLDSAVEEAIRSINVDTIAQGKPTATTRRRPR